MTTTLTDRTMRRSCNIATAPPRSSSSAASPAR